MVLLKIIVLVVLAVMLAGLIPVFITLAGLLLPVLSVLMIIALPGAIIGVLVTWFYKKGGK